MRQRQGKMWWPLWWPDIFMKFNMLWIGSVNLLSVLMKCQTSVVQVSLSLSLSQRKNQWVRVGYMDLSSMVLKKSQHRFWHLVVVFPPPKKRNPNPEMLALCLLFHETKEFSEFFSRKDPKQEVTSKIKEPPNTGQDTKIKFHIHFTFTLKNQCRSQLFNRARDNTTMPWVEGNGIAVSRSLFKPRTGQHSHFNHTTLVCSR